MNARAMKRLMAALPNDPLVISSTQVASPNIVAAKELLHLRSVVLRQPTTQVASFTFFIPAATGSGVDFTVFVGVALSGSGTYIIKRALSTDIFAGELNVSVPATPANTIFASAATSNTITLNGSTTGGLGVGDFFNFTDIASGVWAVSGQTIGSGTVATPFSNT